VATKVLGSMSEVTRRREDPVAWAS
jgi:hypothetical protein